MTGAEAKDLARRILEDRRWRTTDNALWPALCKVDRLPVEEVDPHRFADILRRFEATAQRIPAQDPILTDIGSALTGAPDNPRDEPRP